MHNIHEYLIQVFINMVGFTVERIPKFVISQHCCGVVFWSKCWAKWAAKVSDFYRDVPFGPLLGSVVPFYFWGWYECFPHKLKYIVYMWPCKRHNVLYIHLRRHMVLLPWSWNYNYIHDLENILIQFLF